MTLCYMHTPKAIRAGEPADRLFVVVSTKNSDPGYFLAWKCSIDENGLQHPRTMYKSVPLTAEALEDAARMSGDGSGSTPTAYFKPDSFYKRVTLTQMRRLTEKGRQAPRINKAGLPIGLRGG